MKKKNLLKIVLMSASSLILSACSIKADSPFKVLPLGEQSVITNLPLAGNVRGQYLKLDKGTAKRTLNGELALTFTANVLNVDCGLAQMEMPYMTVIVPETNGSYSYDMNRPAEGAQRPVNFVMKDLANGTPINVLGDVSTVIVESITSTLISGRLAATSFMPDNAYDISGSFELLNCAHANNQPLKISHTNGEVFSAKYSEVVTLTVGDKKVKSLRVMDHTPKYKCNTQSRWFDNELPIKYIELSIANEVTEFKINLKDMTLGMQGSQSGIDFEGFEGQGEVIAKDRFNTTVAISARDTVYGKYNVSGRVTANNCE